jgi:hypothetical protein
VHVQSIIEKKKKAKGFSLFLNHSRVIRPWYYPLFVNLMLRIGFDY